MEFLFTDKGASIEALLVLICLAVILAIYAYDGFVFLRRFLGAFQKIKPTSIPVESHTETVVAEEKSQTPETLREGIHGGEENPTETPITNTEEVQTPETQDDTTKVSEDDIYAEYVALVDETHAEKADEQGEIPEAHEMPERVSETEEHTNKITEEVTPEEKNDEPKEDSREDNMPSEETTKITMEQDDIPYDADKTDEIPAEDVGVLPDTVEIEIAQETPVEKIETEEKDEIEEEKIEKEIVDERESIKEIPEESPRDEDISSSESIEEVSSQITKTEALRQEYQNKKNEEISGTNTEPAPIVRNNTETIFALLNNIRTLIARGQMTEARVLIIQGLALDKRHRELNLMLGSLYENERHFEKAEYVYKDLAMDYPDNIEILEKLGNVLIIEKRYSIGLEIYKKILALGGETEGTLYILSHLCHELSDANEGYIYMKKYLKNWPNNPEILSLMSEVEIELDKRKDAIETLKRLKNLTPYNSEIAATLQKLIMEEELAGNFGGER